MIIIIHINEATQTGFFDFETISLIRHAETKKYILLDNYCVKENEWSGF